MRTFLLLFIAPLLFTHTLSAAPLRQTTAQPPTIIIFTTDLESISLEEAEAEHTTMTVSWHTIHITEAHQLGLDVLRANTWTSLLDVTEALPPVGSRIVPVLHSLNFGPPTYRLTITTRDGDILDRRIITIPYMPTTEDSTPEIQFFGTNAFSVDADVVAEGRARIALVWNVKHRIPTSNLVFEQILAGGRAVSVELPRSVFWIPSSGEGAVSPVLPEGNDIAMIRLRVVDVISGDVYDEAVVNVPVVESPIDAEGDGA
ncbi:MAG: hypothetical protein D6737_08485 [Chloroflexi bacterium]|nr:MAG: hypothetical protein D6737_08485 [Chloroflexota bacterium]